MLDGGYDLQKYPFMKPQGPHMPVTEASVCIPPALWVRARVVRGSCLASPAHARFLIAAPRAAFSLEDACSTAVTTYKNTRS